MVKTTVQMLLDQNRKCRAQMGTDCFQFQTYNDAVNLARQMVHDAGIYGRREYNAPIFPLIVVALVSGFIALYGIRNKFRQSKLD